MSRDPDPDPDELPPTEGSTLACDPENEPLLEGQRVYNGPRNFREYIWQPLKEWLGD